MLRSGGDSSSASSPSSTSSSSLIPAPSVTAPGHVVAQTPGELVDLALRGAELLGQAAVELLPALPERRQLLEPDVAALQPLDDPLQLRLHPLEGGLAHSERA